MSSNLAVINKEAPSDLVIMVKTNKALQHNELGDGYLLKTDLKKEDIISIQLDGEDLKDLSPQELKDKIKETPYLKAQAHSTSTFDITEDDVNFKAKIQAVIDYVNANKSDIEALKKGDKILIDKFLEKNNNKYGNLEKVTKITSEIILKNPEKIDYLAGKTETTMGDMRDNKGAEKDVDDLLGFLKAVVESRTKLNADFKTFKSDVQNNNSKKYKEAEFKGFNSFLNNFRKGKVEFKRYKYYEDDSDNGTEITETYKSDIVKSTEYVGINPDNSEYINVEKDSQKLIALITKFTNEFISYVGQILITPSKTRGGRKSRKLSKGGRRRKTRSNKFA
jgi:hypothetical protein